MSSTKIIKPGAHLTSIITSNKVAIDKDLLSKRVSDIRRQISQLEVNQTEKIIRLLTDLKPVLDENCQRIEQIYRENGCNHVLVEPAIGYFIPHINVQDALLIGAEPSAIITTKDISKDGLSKFLLSAGKVGRKFKQDAEILKFPISKEKFEEYTRNKFENKYKYIGSSTDDQIIPTIEINVDLNKILNEMELSQNYIENLRIYVNIITELAKKNYVASTWPTKRSEFSTIYLQGWEGYGRDAFTWYKGLRKIIERFSKQAHNLLSGSHRMGRQASSKERGELEGYTVRRRLVLVPQKKINTLPGDKLLYQDLLSDNKRAEIVTHLIKILT